MLRSLLIPALIILSCTQAAAQQWRVAAHIREFIVDTGGTQPGYDLYDSTHYSYDYGTDRGSTPMNDSIEYAKCVRYGFDTSLTLTPIEQWVRTYNGDNTVSSIAYYTGYSRPLTLVETDSFTFTNGRVYLRTYYKNVWMRDSNNNYVYVLMPQTNWRNIYYADGQEDVHETVEYWYDQNNIFKPRTKNIIRYDANGNVTADSTYTYTLSGWGNGTGAQYRYTVDGGTGNILASYMLKYVSTTASIDTVSHHLYTYDANGRPVIDSYFLGGNFNVIYKYAYNAQGQLAADSFYDIGSNLNSNFNIYTYTSFGHLDNKVYGTGGITAPPMLVNRERYVYEAYWPVNTQRVSKQADDLVAYPVPSSSFVNIKWHTDKAVQVQGRIVNMQGQIVKQWSDDATGDYYKSIHTANLPAGNYYIVLHTGDKQLQKAIVIVK